MNEGGRNPIIRIINISDYSDKFCGQAGSLKNAEGRIARVLWSKSSTPYRSKIGRWSQQLASMLILALTKLAEQRGHLSKDPEM